MKTIKQLLITIAVLLCSTTTYAYDFEVDGIYYNIISATDFTAEVTSGDIDYSGEVIIPSTVNYNSRTITVTRIGNYAFKNCDELISVTISDNITSIEYGAFYGCSAIISITIPGHVTSIKDYAFNGCSSLKHLYMEDANTYLELGNNCDEQLDFYGNIEIHAKGMFYDCPLETLYLGRNLKYDYDYDHEYSSFNYNISPFNDKTELVSLSISNNVTIIGAYLFRGCSRLTSITIPNSVTKIETRAFADTGLTNITIPSSVTIVEAGGFSNCTQLKDLHIEDGATTLELETSLINYGVSFGMFEHCSLETLYLGRNLDYNPIYGSSPFHGTELNTVIISNCVSTIETNMFRGCSAITSITIPNSVTSIKVSAFESCSRLTSITIPNSVTKIETRAFADTGLTNITIPSSVTIVEAGGFSNCTQLKDLHIEDGATILRLEWNDWHSTSFGEGLFYDCPLETLYIGRNLSYDDTHNYGFSPFCGIERLTSLTIGNDVTNISRKMFLDCSNITSIHLMGVNPPTVDSDNFTDPQYFNISVYVPKGTLEIYQAADVWKNFWNIQEHNLVEYYTVTYMVDNEVYKTQLVANGDIIPEIDEPTKEGYTFSGWSKIPETMPAENVTITGSFSINSYDLVYMLDGEEYKRVTLEFGSEIVPEEEPIKEGYTFSGWSEIPETMPAEDVTVTGSFSINSYDLVYMVDSEEYKRVTLEFGSEIVPEKEPEKEGYTFSGWSEIPETMPAEDVTVTGSFSINSYDLVYMIDGEEYKRVTLEFGSEIIPEDEPTKEGYTFSGWSEIPETMPSHDVEVTGSFIPTNVSEIIAEVSLQINGNNISLSNANNSTVAIYSINGVLVKKIDKYTGEEITLENGVYIVSVGDKAMKIKL